MDIVLRINYKFLFQGTASDDHYWFDSVICYLEFHTNQGRIFGPYGKENPTHCKESWNIEHDKCALTWIAGNEGSRQAGSSDSYLKSLSFNFQC